MYFYLPNITGPMHIQYLRKVILPSIKNAVGICMQITINIYKVTSRLLMCLEFIYSSKFLCYFSYCVFKQHSNQDIKGVKIKLHTFLTSALNASKCQLQASVALSPGKESPVLIGQKTGYDPGPVWTLWSREKSCSCRESNPSCPARGQAA
jgi:hypothetical protein